MQAINAVADGGGFIITVAKKQRPFSNDFVQIKVLESEEPGEVQAYVKCTDSSKEPGRVYFVAYSKATGELIECYC